MTDTPHPEASPTTTRWWQTLLRLLFVAGVAYPVTLLWLGLTVRHRERLPLRGPAIIVANHNSHLDILTLYSLFPLSRVLNVRPAAAADYFLTNRWLAWFASHVVGIIPVIRGSASKSVHPLAGCHDALAAGHILILFPEGTRGEPEQLSELKSGLWYLARRYPDIPIVPVFMYGLGRAMAKGQHVPVPFFVDVHVDRPIDWHEDKTHFKTELQARFHALRRKAAGHGNQGDTHHAPS
ncbi:lysophospholipid acyltransferase family protein [Andreprevotia chitinilytica]|uniref:lysophospholipid acyltransferase family protein n=1 Tax=Andreprevotia chitinilytica TaxID=396808 RepID=UPI00068B72C2|nr:lysophospholipid acyltransferase family protein [Andreprevotia chitinilytica]